MLASKLNTERKYLSLQEFQMIIMVMITMQKVSVFGVILVRIFLHLELIRRDSKYPSISPYSVQMWKNADQSIFEYGHFTQWMVAMFVLILIY